MKGKINILILLLCFSIQFVYQLDAQTLTIGFVKHNENQLSQQLVEQLENVLIEIKKQYPNFPYDKIQLENTQNIYNNIELFQTSFIGTIRPLAYVKASHQQSAPNPLGIVIKDSLDSPFYHSFLIVNKNSGISSFDSDNIKHLILAYKGSTSGDFIPIQSLYKLGVISKPDVSLIKKEKGWDVKYVGSHFKVLEIINANTDAIGGTGENIEAYENIRILKRVMLPQDVLVYSNDLKPYKDVIEKIFLDSKLIKYLTPNFRITGIDKFSLEHEVAYKEIQQLYDLQSKTENLPLLSLFKNNVYFQLLSFFFLIAMASIFYKINNYKGKGGVQNRKEKNQINTKAEHHELIKTGNTSQSIELLIEKAKEAGNGEKLNQLINLSSQLKRYHSKEIIGVNENEIDINKINSSVLLITDQLFKNE